MNDLDLIAYWRKQAISFDGECKAAIARRDWLAARSAAIASNQSMAAIDWIIGAA